jgi:hypothetical protein
VLGHRLGYLRSIGLEPKRSPLAQVCVIISPPPYKDKRLTPLQRCSRRVSVHTGWDGAGHLAIAEGTDLRLQRQLAPDALGFCGLIDGYTGR